MLFEMGQKRGARSDTRFSNPASCERLCKRHLLIFVEVVHTDGPVNDARKTALLQIAGGAGFAPQHVAFVTAYLDRASPTFRKTVSSLAWGSYAWFASEPDSLMVFSGKPLQIEGG